MFKDIKPLAKGAVILIALLIAAVLILLPRSCKAQTDVVPVSTCCSQLIEYKAKYERAVLILDSTRAVGDRIIRTADSRASTALKAANMSIGTLQQQNSRLATKNETLAANLDEVNSQLQTANDELRKWKPRTKAGLFFRKVRNGLAVVGGGALIGIAILAR